MSKAVVAFLLTTMICHAGVQEAMNAMNRGDYKTANKEFAALAKKGDTRAMVTLGLHYHQGTGVKQDYSTAMDWYIKAFKKDNGDAFSNLGVMYRDGLGVEKNKKMAYCLFLITHVCSLGDESTQLRANRNLRRIIPLMTKEELVECFNYTLQYIKAYVESKGTLEGIPKKYKPSKRRLALKDMDWWTPGELDFLGEDAPRPRPPDPAVIQAQKEKLSFHYQLRVTKSAVPKQSDLDIISDMGITGTSLSRCATTNIGDMVIFDGSWRMSPANRRFVALRPDEKHTQVFEVKHPAIPKESDWSKWQKPDFLESDSMAIFALCQRGKTDKANTTIPENAFELRYRVQVDD